MKNPLNQTEKTAGNYYPINSRIYIRDEQANKQLTVVTDRSQGGASIQDGSIEIMLHRRILNDDSLGVSEPLNEPGSDNKGLIVKGKLYVLLDTIENSAKLHRQLALQLNNEPVSLFIGINGLKNEQKMISLYKEMNNFHGLSNTTLPSNLHLLTFMRDFDYETPNTLIIRLEHFYEIGEDSVLSQPVQYDLQQLFQDADVRVLGVEELALGANMNVAELNERLSWNAQPDGHFTKHDYVEFEQQFLNKKKAKLNDYTFDFQPMQIRTFRVWVTN